MEKTRLRKDFFRRIACWLLLDPQKHYRIFPPAQLSPDEIAQLDFYKVCLAKWDAIAELAEENPQSFFDGWKYKYINEGLEYDKRKLMQYRDCSAGELEVMMFDEYFEFEKSDMGFNGTWWDYSPCPKWVLCEQDPAVSLLLEHDFIESLPERGFYCPKYKENWNDGVRKLLTEHGIRSSLKKLADPETGFLRNFSGKPYYKGNLYVTTRNW